MTYTNFDQLPLFLTVPQFAEVLDIGLNSAYALVRSPKVCVIKIGKQYRIPKESIKELFFSQFESTED